MYIQRKIKIKSYFDFIRKTKNSKKRNKKKMTYSEKNNDKNDKNVYPFSSLSTSVVPFK